METRFGEAHAIKRVVSDLAWPRRSAAAAIVPNGTATVRRMRLVRAAVELLKNESPAWRCQQTSTRRVSTGSFLGRPAIHRWAGRRSIFMSSSVLQTRSTPSASLPPRSIENVMPLSTGTSTRPKVIRLGDVFPTNEFHDDTLPSRSTLPHSSVLDAPRFMRQRFRGA